MLKRPSPRRGPLTLLAPPWLAEIATATAAGWHAGAALDHLALAGVAAAATAGTALCGAAVAAALQRLVPAGARPHIQPTPLGGALGALLGTALVGGHRIGAAGPSALGLLGVAVAIGALTPRRAHAPLAILAALAALTRAPAPHWAAQRAAPPPGAQDIVLVTLDTFRADHVGALGGPVPTPNLDRLAERGVLYSEGVAPVPLTLPSHVAMLTGAHPADLGVAHNGRAVPPDAPLVARELAQAGYATGAFVSAYVLRDSTGVGVGFDRFDDRLSALDRAMDAAPVRALVRGLDLDRPTQRRGDATVERALAWWGTTTGPRFLWVHLYDPHSPYAPPDGFAPPIGGPDAPGNPDAVAAMAARRRASGRPPSIAAPSDLRPYVARYAGEIAWTDHVLGALLDGIGRDVAVIVAADHGESLTEHDDPLNHGQALYQTTVRVPVWLAADRVPQGVVTHTPVPLSDVAPTLRLLAGLERDHDTPTLLSRLHDPTDTLLSFAPPQQVRFDLGWRRHWTVSGRHGHDKWIVRTDGTAERYDLGIDPQELRDLSAGDDAWRTHALAWGEARIQELRDQAPADDGAPHQDDAALLRALGYVTD